MAEPMYVKVFITPEIAEGYLAKNYRNRTIIPSKLKYLENQLIVNGKFDLTHQGIAIAEDGELLDGQHRLKAILDTGIGTYMMVCFNAERSPYIDIGTKRREKDSWVMAGIVEKGSKGDRTLVSSLVNFIILRVKGKAASLLMTPYEKYEVYMKNQKIIDKAVDICNAGGKACNARSAAVLYAVCCAYKGGVSGEKLSEWFRILTTMDYYVEGDEKATQAGRSIRLMSMFLNERKVSIKGGGREFAETVIKKAESSIRWYNAGKPIEKLYGEIVYPEMEI